MTNPDIRKLYMYRYKLKEITQKRNMQRIATQLHKSDDIRITSKVYDGNTKKERKVRN